MIVYSWGEARFICTIASRHDRDTVLPDGKSISINRDKAKGDRTFFGTFIGGDMTLRKFCFTIIIIRKVFGSVLRRLLFVQWNFYKETFFCKNIEMNIENKILQGNFLFVFIIVMFILKISINNLDNWRIIEERKSNLFMYNINLPDLGLYFMDNIIVQGWRIINWK